MVPLRGKRIQSTEQTFAMSLYAHLAISGGVLSLLAHSALHKLQAQSAARCCATCYEAPCYGLKKDLKVRAAKTVDAWCVAIGLIASSRVFGSKEAEGSAF